MSPQPASALTGRRGLCCLRGAGTPGGANAGLPAQPYSLHPRCHPGPGDLDGTIASAALSVPTTALQTRTYQAAMSPLSPHARQSATVDAERFRTADPFRHVVIDNFLDDAFCQQLLADFPRFEDRYALNEMGEVGGKAVRMQVRDLSPAYRQLDDYIQTPEFLHYVAQVTGIADLHYDVDYVGGGTHENRHGQSLDAHVDFNYHPGTNLHRRLNLIVYLNPEWEQDWGGALQLFSDPWDSAGNRTTPVLPLFNRAVIFETNEHSWHGFEAIRLPEDKRHLSRKSFAIYLYTRQRPAEEAAPPHGTIYVPEAMPEDWQEGRNLSRADLLLLARRFTRLRGQLRYQYSREQRDGAQTLALQQTVAEWRGAWRLPLQGYALQPAAPSGIWADQWVSPALRLSFVPRRKLRGIEFDLWAPPQLPRAQTLSIDIDGRRWTHRVERGARSRMNLDLRCAADQPVNLSISADTHFVPAADGASGDDRTLAWMLREISLRH